MAQGKGLGGQYVDSPVDLNRKGELGVQLRVFGQLVLKERQLVKDEVAWWQEVDPEGGSGTLALIGSAAQAAAGAALPRRAGRAAAAAFGAGLSAASRARYVRLEWIDGEQSLLRLPERLFSHLRLTPESLEMARDAPAPDESVAKDTPSATDQVLSQIAGLIGDRRATASPSPAGSKDVAEQLLQLVTLRDQGALTEEEFAAAKARLLS